MKFYDYDDNRLVGLPEIRQDWKAHRDEDPENYSPTFKGDILEIILATINYRNNLEIVGLTNKEIDNIIRRIRHEIF